jgi:hypothetical protein
MATFVGLTRDHSGEVIYVNMDKVIQMQRHDQKYTSLTPDNNQRSGVTVSETPEQILDLIRGTKLEHQR